jgi:hypothetical protein
VCPELAVHLYGVTSPIRPPQDSPRTLGIGLRYGPRRMHFFMSEEPEAAQRASETGCAPVGINSSVLVPSFVLELAGISRLWVPIKATEKDDLTPLADGSSLAREAGMPGVCPELPCTCTWQLSAPHTQHANLVHHIPSLST